jgi:transcriptional regulator with XRE-family HTH domain
MEAVTHWTQNSTADFVYSISSNFVAQIETKIEEEGISQNEIACKMNKTSGRVSQVLNNPGNLSIRVMVELARALGMKVSIVAYDDHDPNNDSGPVDPDVFVKCWEHAGRPANLFNVDDAFAYHDLAKFNKTIVTNYLTSQVSGYGVSVGGYVGKSSEYYPTLGTIYEPATFLGNFQLGSPQLPNSTGKILGAPTDYPLHGLIWNEQNTTPLASQEMAA